MTRDPLRYIRGFFVHKLYSLGDKICDKILESAEFHSLSCIFFQKKPSKTRDFTLFLLYLKIKERFFKKLLTGDIFSLYYASFSRQAQTFEKALLFYIISIQRR